MELVPRDHGWPALRRFATVTALLFAVTTLASLTVLATAVHDMRVVDIAALVWSLVALPLVVGRVARALGKPDRVRAVVIAGFVAGLVQLLLVVGATPAQAAPRDLLGGHTRGTVAEVAASPAAWAEVSPVRVWTARITTSSYTSTKDGRTNTTSASVAPVVPELPWTGEVSLFLCGDRKDLVDPGNGALIGSLEPVRGLASNAVLELEQAGMRVGPSPRCVAPTLGGWALTLAIDLVLAVLFTAAIAFTAAWGLVSIALDR